jgi:hypothetical protein
MSCEGFQFTERDAEIVNYVHELRLATIDHLSVLTNRSKKALERRLPKLRTNRYIKRLRPRPHKGLYILGPKGVQVLINAGYAPEEIARRRRREAEWKDLTIPHAELVSSIHAKLLLFSRTSRIRLIEWKHDQPALWDSVETSLGRLPIRPDAHFVLSDSTRPGGNHDVHFFLEADVGTMSHSRVALKIKAYAAYHQQQIHAVRFGFPRFEVAIISQTAARAERLRSQLHGWMSSAQRRAYHVLSLNEFSMNQLCDIGQ